MSKLKVGDWIEVRSKEEILATLDAEGRLDGMPFMPEMFAFCGKRLKVLKSAHKTCDTVFPIRSRSLRDSVHLETRCDGSAHGGCQAGCLIFWKEAWLRPEVACSPKETKVAHTSTQRQDKAAQSSNTCSEDAVFRSTRVDVPASDGTETFTCQATRLPYFTEDLSPFDFRQYIKDYRSGNVTLRQWISGIIFITYRRMIQLGIGWGPMLRWVYERFQRMRGGVPYPRRSGLIPSGQPTPDGRLDIREGELVRVKSYEEILATCNVDNRNRGLFFDAEQVPYCGGTYRVARRVTHIINENTGAMMHFHNPCIILKDVVCQGRYSDCRMFCPRAIHSYWREIWLQRVDNEKGTVQVADR